MNRWLALDIETANLAIDTDADWQPGTSLGVSCWAVAWEQNGEIISHVGNGWKMKNVYAPQMSKDECCELVRKLHFKISSGYTLVTHNGVSFDLRLLAIESGLYAECAWLALHSIDTCLMTLCMKGFPVGLDALAKGMGLSGKTEGISGSLAPQLWAEGKYDEVLAYVAQDAHTTLEVALEIERRKGLSWIAKSGRSNSLPIPKLLTVEECLRLPEPDTSWMTEPMPRSNFTRWMEAVGTPK